MKGRKYSTKNAGCVVVVAAAAKREEEDGGGLGCEGVRAHARSCQKEEVAEDGERASSLTPQLSLRRERERPQQPLFSLSLRERVHSTSSRGEESGGEDPGKKERRGKRVAGGVKGVRVSPEKGVCVECGVCSLSLCLVVGVFRCGGGKRAASKSAQTFLPPPPSPKVKRWRKWEGERLSKQEERIPVAARSWWKIETERREGKEGCVLIRSPDHSSAREQFFLQIN